MTELQRLVEWASQNPMRSFSVAFDGNWHVTMHDRSLAPMRFGYGASSELAEAQRIAAEDFAAPKTRMQDFEIEKIRQSMAAA